MSMKTQRWHSGLQQYVERPDVESFVREILEVCKKYNFSITTGEFLNLLQIEDYDPEVESDLLVCSIDVKAVQ